MPEDFERAVDLLVIAQKAATDPEWVKNNLALAAYVEAQMSRRLESATRRVSRSMVEPLS